LRIRRIVCLSRGRSTHLPKGLPLRLLTTFSDTPQAERFAAHLKVIRIANQLDERDNTRELWIERDDDLARARAELEQFQADPKHARYDGVASVARKVEAEEGKSAERRRRNHIDVRTAWQKPNVGGAIVGISMIAICVVVAILTRLGSMEYSPVENALLFQTFERAYGIESIEGKSDEQINQMLVAANQPPTMWSSITRGEVWRLVTPMFLHFGGLHLMFNMFWLWSFTQAIEGRKGAMKFAALVLFTSAIASLGEALWVTFAGTGFAASGGMSGVNYGLFGYLWLKGKLQPAEQMGVSKDTVMIMIFWLFLCMTGLVGNIANAAHVCGLIAGMAVVAVPWQVRRIQRRGR